MATFKRINGNYTIKTLNHTDTVTVDAVNTVITGDLTVQGNATLVGNINADRIFYGNSSVEIPVPGGNVAVSVDGTSNVAVFSSSTLSVSGNIAGNYFLGNGSQLIGVVATDLGVIPTLSVTGNIDAGNVRTADQISATGDVTGGNLLTSGNVSSQGNVIATQFRGDLIGSVFADDSSLIVDAIDSCIFANSVAALGNVTGGNFITAGTITATGNIVTAGTFVGNFSGNITGNLTVPGSNTQIIFNNQDNAAASSAFTFDSAGNTLTVAGTATVTGNVVAGNVNTADQISATGNVTAGNVLVGDTVNATTYTGTAVSVTGNVTGGNLISSNIVSSNLTMTAANVTFALSGNVNLGTSYINNVNSPIQGSDAATKQYVDDSVSTGIIIHTPVRVESPTALTATYAPGGNVFTVTDTIDGNTVVFSTAANLQVNDQLWFANSFQGITANNAYFVVSAPNTSAAVLTTTYNGLPVSNITSASGMTQSVRVNSGVGATLTNAGDNAALIIDGITLAANDRVLVYTQANAAHNGVYTVSNVGNATVAWVMTRSSDTDTYAPDDINALDAGDYFFVQQGDTGEGESYVMTLPVGPLIIGYNNLVFTQFSASKAYQAGDGLTLTGTTFSVNIDNTTTAIVADVVVVKSGANLVTPNIGNATGNSLTLDGNGAINTTTATATGNIVGGNVLTAGLISATGNVSGGNLSAGLGTVTLGNIVNANGNGVGNIGSASLYFDTVFAKATSAQYADLAEMYAADSHYETGTVLSMGGTHEVTLSNHANDQRVAGVVSANPAYIMNTTIQAQYPVALALAGRVPTNVIGPVRKGDMMVAAGNGRAQSCTAPAIGTVIGKSLEDFDGIHGTIEIIVGRL